MDWGGMVAGSLTIPRNKKRIGSRYNLTRVPAPNSATAPGMRRILVDDPAMLYGFPG